MKVLKPLAIGVALAAGLALLWAPSSSFAHDPDFASANVDAQACTPQKTIPSAAGEPPADTKKTGVRADPRPPHFVPPATDRPAVRLRSASSRGLETSLPGLYTLSPEAAGLTVSAQPTLFWYLDQKPPEGAQLIFTLVDEREDAPVLELPIGAPATPGIYEIPLADHAVTLSPGVAYEWSVSLVVDSEQWSLNPYAVGGIERVAAPTSLASRLSSDGSSAHVYAELGLWYDALAAASDMIAATPDREEPVEIRAALLRQVGLEEIVH